MYWWWCEVFTSARKRNAFKMTCLSALILLSFVHVSSGWASQDCISRFCQVFHMFSSGFSHVSTSFSLVFWTFLHAEWRLKNLISRKARLIDIHLGSWRTQMVLWVCGFQNVALFGGKVDNLIDCTVFRIRWC